MCYSNQPANPTSAQSTQLSHLTFPLSYLLPPPSPRIADPPISRRTQVNFSSIPTSPLNIVRMKKTQKKTKKKTSIPSSDKVPRPTGTRDMTRCRAWTCNPRRDKAIYARQGMPSRHDKAISTPPRHDHTIPLQKN